MTPGSRAVRWGVTGRATFDERKGSTTAGPNARNARREGTPAGTFGQDDKVNTPRGSRWR